MNITKTAIDKVLILEPKVFKDHRGWFIETYSKIRLQNDGIDIEFVQDNHSMSVKKGTLRGLHLQMSPKSQTKLVWCTKGRIFDAVVDLRRGSATYKQWIGVELSEENKKQLLIPKGFAHGFLTLTDDVEVQYKVDEYYAPECDRSIRFDDPEIGVKWPIENPLLSDKDLKAPLLKDSDIDFSLKYMVTGKDGQLGHDILDQLKSLNLDVIAPARTDFDLSKADHVKAYIIQERPDVIIHCAAYTAVDKAEEEKDLCYMINVEGTRALAEAAKLIGAKVVYISTDYVFGGIKDKPHDEYEDTNPINHYGYTKEQGEKIIKEMIEKYFIVRTSWLYGRNGNNFVKKMIELAQTHEKISVVSDQVGAPTYTIDLAKFVLDLVATEHYGIYHGVNEGYCSWYEFAKLIFKESKLNVTVNPITTDNYPTKAKRPLNSRLSKNNTIKAGIERMPNWEDALHRFLSSYDVSSNSNC